MCMNMEVLIIIMYMYIKLFYCTLTFSSLYRSVIGWSYISIKTNSTSNTPNDGDIITGFRLWYCIVWAV